MVDVTPVVEGEAIALQTRDDGVGVIQAGAFLVWEGVSKKLEQLGTHYFPGRKGPFDRVHPMTIALAEESRRRLMESGHKGAWRLGEVNGLYIRLEPVKATASELEEKFNYPEGELAYMG